ncbi:long-chain fatty acid--CoA ligase [bacterium]|jgi:long-chain acyl-CoA synthetase|nr:long-chain fatty acid--CoA ligase [Verrucomicrobiota bacterium]MDA7497355.1 long-chain fatty acid--CoA ligase [bacterium]MDA7510509.1 long-chain fatty acid--CoA ligase [Verrucomicrobiota bacterium]
MLNCSVILDGSAQSVAELTAVVMGEDRWTYDRLNRAACQFAGGLVRAGVEKGDRIVLACPNRVEFIVAFFGILKCGASVVPVSILSKRREIAFVMEDTQATGMVCFEGSETLSLGKEGRTAFDETESCRLFWWIARDSSEQTVGGMPTLYSAMEGVLESFPSVLTEPTDIAVILYTSGTTGKPKGAVLSHQNIFTTALTAGRLSNMNQKDVSLVTLPLFHCYAQTVQMNAGLYYGSSMVLLERFDPDLVLQAMQDHNVTLFCGVPTMYWALLNHEGSENYDLEKIASNLRLGCSGGAPIPVEVIRGVEEKYQFQILEGYGLSETSAMATFNQSHRPRKIGSVGLPVWGVEIQVVDDDMNPMPTGERGEVVIRGHSVMQGYFNRPDLTEEVFRDGWFHTGDVGQLDEDGYLYIVDRTKDMIIRGGFNVYPREIEEVLATHPEVSLSAVIGVPHEKYGEEVMAFTILKEGATVTEEQIVVWSKQEMASYKYPRVVKIVEALPLGATGKVLKKELRVQLERGEV